MDIKRYLFVLAAASAFVLPFAASASTLTVSCAGAPAATSITWTASTTGGVSPVAFLWSNGSMSTVQTVATAPGTYAMTLQATDASSSVATTTCSATIAVPEATSTSVMDQINALLAEIAALKAQLAQLLAQQAAIEPTATSTATSTSCFNFTHDLKEGDQGDDVKDLQKTLASDPALFPADLITGYFGLHTEDAVKKFQEKYGLPSTGYFGPKSRAYFEDQCSTGDSNHDGVPNSLDESSNPEIDNEHQVPLSSPSSSNGGSEGDQHQ